jgi:hypothetical protein
MKKRISRLLAFGAIYLSLLFFTGCHNKNAFDFSRLNGVECEGDWGFPLLNAQYTIEDILTMVDNPDFLQVGDDGSLEIIYEYEMDSVISASNYLDSYFHSPIEVSGSESYPSISLPLPSSGVLVLFEDTLKAVLPADKVYIIDASIKSGIVNVSLNYNIPFSTRVVAYSPQLRNSSGQMFRIEENISGGHFEKNYDLSGYQLAVPDDQSVDIYLEVTCSPSGGTLPSQLSFSYDVSFSQIRFSQIRGNFAAITLPVDQEWDFNMNFLKEYITGSITLMNPKLTCEIMNTFPVEGKVKVDEAMLSGNGVSSSLINGSTGYLDIPGSTVQFTPIEVPLASSIFISPDFSHFSLNGTAVINPNGLSSPVMVFRDDQLISLRFKIVLPLQLSVNNVTFRDTIEFGGLDIPDEPAFSNLLVRLGITNGIPLNFNLQAYFYDSTTGTVKDSLFVQPRTILSAQNGHPRTSELFAAKENLNEVQRMLTCDNIILKAAVFTEGGPVTISSDQFLKVMLSGRFNVDVNQLVDIGN